MKRSLICSLFLFLALTTAQSAICFGQEPPRVQQTSAEPLGENEPLPFMRSEQSSPVSEEPGSAGLLLKTLGSMIFIVGLIFFGAWGAKKLGYGNGKAGSADTTQLSVLTSVSLGNGRTVSAIRFGTRVLLVGSTPQSFTLLGEEADKHGEQAAPRSVAELLADDEANFHSELRHAESRLNSFLTGGKAS